MLGLDKTARKVVEHLRGFSPTAKLLVSSLMVILIMGLLLVAVYAGRSDMTPLGLSGALGPEARARAVSYLDARGIAWEERGGDLAVPVEQKYAVLAQLTENELIAPEEIDFDSILKEDSPFLDVNTRRTRYLVAKMNVVGRMISAMQGIERATVVIDQPDRSRGLGAPRIPPTASVNVLTRSGPLSREQGDAIARVVAGAHAELKVANVTVIDARTGRAVEARTDDEVTAGRYLELKQANEQHVRQKIEEFLSYIPGVRVAVNAQVEGSEVETHRVGVDDPKLGVTEDRQRERNMTNAAGAGEPGVRANVGEVLALSRGRDSTYSDNEAVTRTIPAFGTQDTVTRKDNGYALKINATVKVPRSWFVELFREQQGDPAAEPDAAALQTLVDGEAARIRTDVEPLIDTDAKEGAVPGTVVVSMYTDLPGTDGAGARGTSLLAGGPAGGGLLSQHILEPIGLGALAVVSLLLMFMMVRKATRGHEMPSAEELVGIPPALADHDSDLVGEADETVAAMDGVEIDENAVRRQQMLEQINDLAVNASDEVAGLLRKWIKKDG